MKKILTEILKDKREEFCDFASGDKVVLYGAGQMGIDASNCLADVGLSVEYFADKNPNLLGKLVNGIEVRHPESFTKEELENYVFAISLVTVSYNIIHDYLKALGCKKICFVGDLVNKTCQDKYISKAWRLININDDEIRKINAVFEKYSDEDSKKSLIQHLDWSINGKERNEFVQVLKMEEKYFIQEVLNALTEEDVIISYDFLSQNIEAELKEKNIGFKRLIVINPVKDDSEISHSSNVFCHKIGLANEEGEKYFVNAKGLTVKSRFLDSPTDLKYKVKKFDDLVEEKYSYLKVYGLGIALDVIKGAIESIKKNRPVLAVTIHHTREDFVEIPVLLTNNLENYDFYLRLHAYCGFETIFYAVPKEKVKK